MGNIFSCCAPQKKRHRRNDAPEGNTTPQLEPATNDGTPSSPVNYQPALVLQGGHYLLDYALASSESALPNEARPASSATVDIVIGAEPRHPSQYVEDSGNPPVCPSVLQATPPSLQRALTESAVLVQYIRYSRLKSGPATARNKQSERYFWGLVRKGLMDMNSKGIPGNQFLGNNLLCSEFREGGYGSIFRLLYNGIYFRPQVELVWNSETLWGP